MSDLLNAAKAVVDAVTFDDSGFNGQGGNGGLISRETIRKVDVLRQTILRMEKAAAEEKATEKADG